MRGWRKRRLMDDPGRTRRLVWETRGEGGSSRESPERFLSIRFDFGLPLLFINGHSLKTHSRVHLGILFCSVELSHLRQALNFVKSTRLSVDSVAKTLFRVFGSREANSSVSALFVAECVFWALPALFRNQRLARVGKHTGTIEILEVQIEAPDWHVSAVLPSGALKKVREGKEEALTGGPTGCATGLGAWPGACISKRGVATARGRHSSKFFEEVSLGRLVTHPFLLARREESRHLAKLKREEKRRRQQRCGVVVFSCDSYPTSHHHHYRS
ncbi:hypothetical protein JTE90_007889 [Oedothorax gibbosus]|uniref:Uncharacterized protein n=1 Tax=Oedothorax gibbosus TaxID=931172 RepID=A0AAV6VHK9_9ARAC|nr:hypothetical protein JTE90_007889 [Oedothorax gibbosus]